MSNTAGHFLLHEGGASTSWTWRWMHADGAIHHTSEPQSSFGHAVADAIAHGFRPKTEPWVVISAGRYTHFRPGERPINIPDDRDPATPLNIHSPEPELGLPTSGEPGKAEVKPTGP